MDVRNRQGWTALEVACNSSNREVARVLKERGARVRRAREVLEGCFLRRDTGIIGVLMSDKRDVRKLMESKDLVEVEYTDEFEIKQVIKVPDDELRPCKSEGDLI